jgi:hypothetical protein
MDLGEVMDPGHQRCADATRLVGWIDGHPPNVQIAPFEIKPQAADCPTIQQRERAVGTFEILSDRRFGFAQGAAWWIEPRVLAKCALSQPMNL